MSKIQVADEPWWTPGAIKLIEDHLCNVPDPGADILEFGCGGSTVWLSRLCASLISVDHNQEWVDAVNQKIGDLEPLIDVYKRDRPYHTVCDKMKGDFDLVCVDGRDRIQCVQASKALVRPGGILLLDNSEREKYKPIFSMLKTWHRIETSWNYFHHLKQKRIGWSTTMWMKP